jgi:hypothetical protein
MTAPKLKIFFSSISLIIVYEWNKINRVLSDKTKGLYATGGPRSPISVAASLKISVGAYPIYNSDDRMTGDSTEWKKSTDSDWKCERISMTVY